MKVLFANKFFYRNGGAEVVMFQERDFLQRLGHQIVDFSMQDERNVDSAYASFFVQRQDYRGAGTLDKIGSVLSLVHSPEAVRKIGKLIDETRPDLVHCHNIYHQLTPSIIGAAASRGIPVILTAHDFKTVCPVYTRLHNGTPCSDCLSGDFSQLLRKRCAEGSLGRSALLYAEATIQRRMGSYERVTRFLTPSRFMRDSITHRFSAGQVSMLYNGVDVEAIRPSGRDEGYVLYLGRLSAEKGVETLLRAQVKARGAWPLIIAGSGPLGGALNLKYNNATFAGHLVGDELTKAISHSSVVVVPSEWYENCPMSVLEAMAYGKPVVGSRIGGIPELVVEGETGLLFETGNADQLREHLDTLMGSPKLRQSMGELARQRAESEFSLDKHNAGLMAIYTDILDSK